MVSFGEYDCHSSIVTILDRYSSVHLMEIMIIEDALS